jgi:hypothetical protein
VEVGGLILPLLPVIMIGGDGRAAAAVRHPSRVKVGGRQVAVAVAVAAVVAVVAVAAVRIGIIINVTNVMFVMLMHTAVRVARVVTKFDVILPTIRGGEKCGARKMIEEEDYGQDLNE